MIYVDGYVPQFRAVLRVLTRSDMPSGTIFVSNGTHLPLRYDLNTIQPQFFPDLPPYNPPAHWAFPPDLPRPLRCTAPLSGRAAPRPTRLAQGRSGKRTRASHALHRRRG